MSTKWEVGNEGQAADHALKAEVDAALEAVNESALPAATGMHLGLDNKLSSRVLAHWK